MTTHVATVSCLLDEGLVSPMSYRGCYTQTALCQTVRSPHVWSHFICSREDTLSGSRGELMINGTIVNEETTYKATIGDLFSAGILILGSKQYQKKSTGFNLSLIHICRCRRYAVCRSRWSPYH
eukprot:TRINITY_DN5578_c0_g2_i4.p2 TRINITY_DN5578_c0_g2~~TRINITY_DN5578_c0_g2_i4.p2  ORF type:complete len:124 (+),score=17.90 TRINITY_DN5578_c0_g2_i4:1167-1538(+)